METSKHPAQGRAGRGRDELAALQGDREHVPLSQAQSFPECRGQHHPAPVSHAKLECGTHDSRVPPALEGGRLGDSDPGSARVHGDRMGVHPRRIPDREGAVCLRDPGVPEEFNVVAVVLF